jgi:hypothetical protein
VRSYHPQADTETKIELKLQILLGIYFEKYYKNVASTFDNSKAR